MSKSRSLNRSLGAAIAFAVLTAAALAAPANAAVVARLERPHQRHTCRAGNLCIFDHSKTGRWYSSNA